MLQVLDDNVYELRSRQHEVSTTGGLEDGAGAGSRMQIESDGPPLAPQPAAALAETQPGASLDGSAAAADIDARADLAGQAAGTIAGEEQKGQSGAELASAEPDEEEERRSKKKVRFVEPWVPPHRREGNGEMVAEQR